MEPQPVGRAVPWYTPDTTPQRHLRLRLGATPKGPRGYAAPPLVFPYLRETLLDA